MHTDGQLEGLKRWSSSLTGGMPERLRLSLWKQKVEGRDKQGVQSHSV